MYKYNKITYTKWFHPLLLALKPTHIMAFPEENIVYYYKTIGDTMYVTNTRTFNQKEMDGEAEDK